MASTSTDDLKDALQQFVEQAAKPLHDGVAYLLNKVDDGFYVPIVCSKQEVFDAAPYYLLFSKPPSHKITNGNCCQIENSVEGWLGSGRIEALVFAENAGPVFQEFTNLSAKQDNSLLLVRSACSQIPHFSPDTKMLCNPLLSLVFSRWADTSYKELLSSIEQNKGVVELSNVMDSLVRILDDRNPFPPYWPFSYFSLKVKSGDTELPEKLQTNALGLARWSLKELRSLKPPWIARMATVITPEWEDIQAVAVSDAQYKHAVEKGDATAKILIERLWDWIVPVCNFGEWKFYARHNKRKDCKRGCPLAGEESSPKSAHAAVARILKHLEQGCANGDDENSGDFLVTLWALKANSKNEVLDAIPIGGRAAKDFSYLIENIHSALPQQKDFNNGHSKLEIRYAPIPDYKKADTEEMLVNLATPALAALRMVDPQAQLKNCLLQIFESNNYWDDFFPSDHPTRYHHVATWKSKNNSQEFQSLRERVEKSVETLAGVLKLTGTASGKDRCELNDWFLHTAKAMNHKRVSPELISYVAGRIGLCSSRAYEIVGVKEAAWMTSASLAELASDLLYGCALLASSGDDSMNLVECYVREEMLPSESPIKQPLLVMRFESDFKEGYEHAHSAAQAFRLPDSWHDGDEIRRGCFFLRRHAISQKVGITHRDCVKYTMLFEFKLRDIEDDAARK